MARKILAMDQGTTSSRSLIFDEKGQILEMAQQEFEQIFPRPGWVEHDANEIWQSQLRTAREVLQHSNISASDILAIGITNQRETTLIWDRKTGEPIHNAIVWQDRRTSDICNELSRDPDAVQLVQERTGLVIDAYFSGSKIRWLLDHVPEARQRAENGELAFGSVDTWLIWQLTGGRLHITDLTNAGRTMLCRTDTGEWDQELLQLLQIPDSLLPEIRQSSEIYAETDSSIFGSPIKIAGMAGDQHAALFGQGCHHPGMAKNTYGTGCFLLMHTGTERLISRNKLLSTVAWKIDGVTEFALEGSVFIAGAVVQWLRDQLGIIDDSADIEALAASVEDSGGVSFVPAFSGLGAPHWDGFARGSIQGITRGTGKAHLARAALEAIALQTLDLVTAMENDSDIKLEQLRVDGGASNNQLLMQIQSDLLGVPVVRSTVSETTALGAAALAGLAVGMWSSREEIAELSGEKNRFQPASDTGQYREVIENWHRAVSRSKQWVTEAS